MSHFAHLNSLRVVDQVITAEQEFVDGLPDPENWIQTSYNTIGGVHVDPETRIPDGGQALYKNYAGIGYSFDGVGFAAPQPFASWTLDAETYQWTPPMPMPDDGKAYAWFEEAKQWISIPALNVPEVGS